MQKLVSSLRFRILNQTKTFLALDREGGLSASWVRERFTSLPVLEKKEASGNPSKVKGPMSQNTSLSEDLSPFPVDIWITHHAVPMTKAPEQIE